MLQILNRKGFIDELKHIIKTRFGDNVTNFSKIAGIHPSRMHDYLKGGCFPKAEKLEKIARAAGMSIAELYAEGSAAEEFVVKEAGTAFCSGHERRGSVLYTEEERLYMEKLLDVLRGSNKKNASAIKENIDAFYETRNFNTSGAVKKTNNAG